MVSSRARLYFSPLVGLTQPRWNPSAFLKAMGEIYEVVIFTASLSKYADPVLDQLDIHRVVKHRLFRESCYNNKGNYVKVRFLLSPSASTILTNALPLQDLSQLGRPMSDCIIIDNSPASYVFHPNNAVPISSWFNDPFVSHSPVPLRCRPN